MKTDANIEINSFYKKKKKNKNIVLGREEFQITKLLYKIPFDDCNNFSYKYLLLDWL